MLKFSKMCFSSSDRYRAGYQAIARDARVLSHPARLLILDQLRDGSLTLAQLMEDHPISRGTVCEHLRALIREGFVRVESRPSPASYAVNVGEWSATVRVLVSAAREMSVIERRAA